MRKKAAIVREAVAAAVERETGFEGRRVGRCRQIPGWDVGQICDDDVVATISYRFHEIATMENAAIGYNKALGIFARDRDRGRGYIGCLDACSRLGGDSACDRAAPSTDVEYAHRSVNEAQRFVDKVFRFRARDEYVLVDDELPTVEPRAFYQIGDRDARSPAIAERLKSIGFFDGWFNVDVRNEPSAIAPQNVGEQQRSVGLRRVA